jgi:hypothetical protein
MICLLAYMANRAFNQMQLDAKLIDAIKNQDTPAAIALLKQGANPNARDIPPDTRPAWKKLWDSLPGHRHPNMGFQTALLLTVQGPPGTGPARENLPLVKALLDRGASVNA